MVQGALPMNADRQSPGQPCRPTLRFLIQKLRVARVSGQEAVHAWENGYDQGTWVGDDEIPFGENHHIQMHAGLSFLSNGVMTTDEQPMALHEVLETRGSRKTGADSKTSTAAKVDRGELDSLLAASPWAR